MPRLSSLRASADAPIREPRRSLGATDLDIGQGDVPWTCLSDPDGHEFCVVALS